jgi:hypothetical protein
MRQGIEQVQPQPWANGHGECIAVLAASPTWLADHYELQFFEGFDNLDDYRAAAVRLPSGRILGLLRHAGAPDPGTEVHADPLDDPDHAVSELLDALGLPSSACTWMRRGTAAAAQAPTRLATG